MINPQKIDKSNMREIILKMPSYIKDAVKLTGEFRIQDASSIRNIIIAGMGGSAIGGDILKTYLQNTNSKLRIEVNREYELPSYAGPDTLVFVSSYSGNTEETIAAYRNAIRKRCKIIGITSDGKLKELCQRNNHEHVVLPRGFQPRAALPYSFFVLLKILENSGLIPEQGRFIEDTIMALGKPNLDELAKSFAKTLIGKIPLIYTSKRLSCVGYRWKCQFNENSKIHAFSHIFSELDHNEIVGYTTKTGNFHVILLKDDLDSEQVKKRFGITKELIKQKGYPTSELLIRGPNEMTKIFSTIFIGDLTSYYLALENNIDPTPVEIVEDLKKKLQE